MSSVAILILLKLGKTYLSEHKRLPKPIQAIFWFLGTTRSAMVVILMGIVGFLVEDPVAIENFLLGCHPGTDDCTKMTLTKIHNIAAPSFSVPVFDFSYEYCCDGHVPANRDLCDPHPNATLSYSPTQSPYEYVCNDRQTFNVDISMMFRIGCEIYSRSSLCSILIGRF